MDLDWCLTCSQHTSGTLYCSDNCRLQDLKGPALMSSSSSFSKNIAPIYKLHVKPAFSLPRIPSVDYLALSSSSSSSSSSFRKSTTSTKPTKIVGNKSTFLLSSNASDNKSFLNDYEKENWTNKTNTQQQQPNIHHLRNSNVLKPRYGNLLNAVQRVSLMT
ncbi:hypothetical protein G9A89_007181 [Geosiphon pyriformis]|nr:hypothetical protein G9A89_007181 [Geosiphon pyriformis]